MTTLKGKKFTFAIIAIICVTVATIIREYAGDVYLKLVGLVTGIFTFAQAFTDVKKNGGA